MSLLLSTYQELYKSDRQAAWLLAAISTDIDVLTSHLISDLDVTISESSLKKLKGLFSDIILQEHSNTYLRPPVQLAPSSFLMSIAKISSTMAKILLDEVDENYPAESVTIHALSRGLLSLEDYIKSPYPLISPALMMQIIQRVYDVDILPAKAVSAAEAILKDNNELR